MTEIKETPESSLTYLNRIQELQFILNEEFENKFVIIEQNKEQKSHNNLLTSNGVLIGITGENLSTKIVDNIIKLNLSKHLQFATFKFDDKNIDRLPYFPEFTSLTLLINSSEIKYLPPNLNYLNLEIKATNKISIKDAITVSSLLQLKRLVTNIVNIDLIKSQSIERLDINNPIDLSCIHNIPSLLQLQCFVSAESRPLPKTSCLETISIGTDYQPNTTKFDEKILASNTINKLKIFCNHEFKMNAKMPKLTTFDIRFFIENLLYRDFRSMLFKSACNFNFDLESLIVQYPTLIDVKVHHGKIIDKPLILPCDNLKHLGLAYCNLHSLNLLSSFPNLEEFQVPGNFIQDISTIEIPKKISMLNFYNNSIISITKSFNDLTMTEMAPPDYGDNKYMIVGENPLVNPPIEIIKLGYNAQQSYFESMQGEIEELNEAKIIFLGPGSVGKTSLMKCLSGKPFNPQEDTTHGINIQKYPIKLNNGSTINAKIWDFGGQQINHTTHQLFLSQRCVYVLVINDRINDEPQDQKIDYWLQQVKAFGGDSKVIIVRNKCEQFKHSNLQEGLLRSKFPNITTIESVSCKENINIDLLRERLNNEVAQLPMRQMQLPKNWLEVKNEVQCIADKLDHFSLTKFREICCKHGIPDDIAQQTLQDLLHDLSLIIVFPELAAYDMGVLNPYWITDGIYSIINCHQFEKQKGLVTQQEVQSLLDTVHPNRYKNKAKFIIDSLLKFELCHSVGTDTSNTYLVPSLLPPLDQEIKLPHNGNTVSLIFNYENLLPKSIFTKFLVRMNKDISADCRWKSAAILADVSFNAKALVIEDDVNKTITVKVSGEQARDYFSVIRKTINDLNHPDAEKLGVTELILLPNSNGASVPYAELIGYEAEGEETYLHGITRKRYNVSKLLSGIESRQDTAKRVNELNNKDITVNVTNNIENNSNATNSNTSTQDQVQTTTQSVDVNITLDLQMFKGSANNVIDDLREDLSDEIEDERTLRRATRECDKVQAAIDDIQDVKTSEEALEKIGSFERLRNFFDGALKGNSSIGEHLKMLRETTGQIKDVAKKYNGIASYFGLPTIPEVLL